MQFKSTSLFVVVFSILSFGKLHGQCDLACPGSLEVFIPEEGTLNLGLFDVLDSLPADCPSADSLVLLPNQLNCDFAGSTTPYQIQHARTGEVLCSGVLAVKDTTPQELICRENVTIFLPEDRGFRNMIQADYVFAILDNCDRNGIFSYSPKVVDCDDVGKEVPYSVMSIETGDTLCSGNVTVLDTTSAEIKCKGDMVVELSPSGFPTIVFPTDVLEAESDNCQRLNSLSIKPALFNCNMQGENDYTVTDRTTGDTLCTGTILVRDPILPEVECKDTFQLYLPEDGSTVGLAPADLVTLFSDNCGTVDNLQILPVDSFDCSAANTVSEYQLVPKGSNIPVCSGVIEVIDTFVQVVECEENIIVSLPLTYEGFRLSSDIFIKNELRDCNGVTGLKTYPEAVFCYNAGQEIDYSVTNEGTGDTLCVGTLKVEDSGSPALTCVDTFQVSLPSSGRPYNLNWIDVVRSFSDNCLSILDLEVSPRFVDCSDAGQSINYSVTTRNNQDILCEGVVEVIDEVALSIQCKEVVEAKISPSGFPAILFGSSVIDQISDNCTRTSDFRVSPTFFFCPDTTTYTLIDRRTNEVACTGQVIVTGNPSRFGRCDETNSVVDNNSSSLRYDLAPSPANTIQLFPNPTRSDVIQVIMPQDIAGEVDYEIVDLLGKRQKIGRMDYQGGSIRLSLDGMAAGTYMFVAYTSDGKRISQRFVKMQ